MTDQPRMISVLSSTNGCIGFLRNTARGVTAYDADGQPLGLFEDKTRAVEAIASATMSQSAAAAGDRHFWGKHGTI
jgi:hypothetical protein